MYVISFFFTGNANASMMKIKAKTIPPNALRMSFSLKSST